MSTPAAQAATSIWQAGVRAVRATTLIQQHVGVDDGQLRMGEHRIDLSKIRRIGVVGAGKAAGYMAQALEDVLRPAAGVAIEGWVNVPENCLVDTEHIKLHGARPAGVNEPHPEGVVGAERITALLRSLEPEDLCICLITGGGSALLPAPAPGISLADKLAVTKLLSARGATIQELNRVRIELSTLKGGGLARACGARRLIALIVSDIIGDPLDLIGSGPTVYSTRKPSLALEILHRYAADVPPSVITYLAAQTHAPGRSPPRPTWSVENIVLGSNATAVAAAEREAVSQGFAVEILEPEAPQTAAEEVGIGLASRMRRPAQEPQCVIWGGEPVVTLAEPDVRGQGGRNQQLVLAAAQHWIDDSSLPFAEQMCLLSGGTDGEDGPTDAAGAFLDAKIMRKIVDRKLQLNDYLRRNDAYNFFSPLGGLLVTGPTQTNVCDLRVAVF